MFRAVQLEQTGQEEECSYFSVAIDDESVINSIVSQALHKKKLGQKKENSPRLQKWLYKAIGITPIMTMLYQCKSINIKFNTSLLTL